MWFSVFSVFLLILKRLVTYDANQLFIIPPLICQVRLRMLVVATLLLCQSVGQIFLS